MRPARCFWYIWCGSRCANSHPPYEPDKEAAAVTNPDISSEAYAFDRAMWTGMMLGAHAAMSPTERAELESWERSNLTGDGEIATSDWPGWSRYLPPRPEPPK